ncbi:hypothetical protein EXIGLDRAFT_845975 [Exidia glandulosa HHB12029]|uniref:Uncharacterized protein n=1 Tax=Exidia glandulosa HHB12029 TaxID=1314781 RepID=A0A165B7D0_EXIGL|nr:hypothetical protein EXIGLDRAFT_845975 [Exidia glandulosa HHB12029]
MFTRIATVSLLALAALAKPVDVSARTFGNSISFNGWHGISSLSGFDNFYGVDNFSGSVSEQVFAQQDVVVCHRQDINIIQQQIAVLVENMKRVISEQVCEVETQTILVSQVQSHFSSFSEDVRHVSSRHVGFDHVIASHISNLYDESGSFSGHDLGFSGHDIGSHSSFVLGNNWNQATSPAIVSQAFSDAQSASGFTL